STVCRGDECAKSIEPGAGRDPYGPFPVFEDRQNLVAGQAVGTGEGIEAALVKVQKPTVLAADPVATVAIAQQPGRAPALRQSPSGRALESVIAELEDAGARQRHDGTRCGGTESLHHLGQRFRGGKARDGAGMPAFEMRAGADPDSSVVAALVEAGEKLAAD